MKLRVLVSALVAVVASLGIASVADAHTLKLKRAKNTSLRDAKALCFETSDCTYYGVERCRRPGFSGHRRRHHARCRGFVGGVDEQGEWECTWIDAWSIRKGSRRLRWNRKVFRNTLQCYDVVAVPQSSASARHGGDAAASRRERELIGAR